MKLAVYPGMYVPHVGGLETHVDELVKHLKEQYEITIIAPQIPKSAPIHEIRHGSVTILRYPAWEIIQHFPIPNIFTRQFRDCIIKSDVYMTRTRFFPNSLLGFIISKFYKKPNIHVEHGSAHVQSSNRFVNLVAKIIDHTYGRLIIKGSKECVSISEAVQAFIQNTFNRKTKIIRRGIEPEIPQRKSEYEFVFVGRIVVWKGIFNLVKAFSGSKHKLDIFGYGPDEKWLRKMVNTETNINFHGKVSHREAIRIKGSAKYYVHSSLPGGGLSSGLMESLWVGTPVLATPNEGAQEIVNSVNGLLLKGHKVEDLKEGINNICNLTFHNSKIAECAQKDFSWEQSIRKYEKILNSINL